MEMHSNNWEIQQQSLKSKNYPTEPKVKAATVGGGAGAVVGGFVVWLLDQLLWNGDNPPDVPAPVELLVMLVVPAALAAAAAYGAGWQAKHVNRPS
jgi:hypothetical protein